VSVWHSLSEANTPHHNSCHAQALLPLQAVDWWALGVCIYVMLVGRYPFSSPNRAALFHVRIPLGVALFCLCVLF
jgi:hypothetical protein